jgi:hypothetical protein
VRRSIRSVMCSLVILTVLGHPSGAVTGPHKILGGPEDQALPFVNGTYMVWTQDSEARPNRYNAFASLLDGSGRFKLNAKGTRGFTGGIDPGTDVAIYQQADGQRSNLFTIDLVTRVRTKLPTPVNSSNWEWAPRISNAYILFQRDAQSTTTLWLYDRGGNTPTSLHSVNADRVFMYAGAVGEQFASWTVCGQGCNAFVYDITTATKTKLPVPTGRHQYAPVVDEDHGNVYFVRSGDSCGANVGIWRRPVDLSGPAEEMVSFPDGIDTGWTLALDEDVANARLDAWFQYFRCAAGHGDIFEVRELDTLV